MPKQHFCLFTRRPPAGLGMVSSGGHMARNKRETKTNRIAFFIFIPPQ
jgi:hypothetical protein